MSSHIFFSNEYNMLINLQINFTNPKREKNKKANKFFELSVFD